MPASEDVLPSDVVPTTPKPKAGRSPRQSKPKQGKTGASSSDEPSATGTTTSADPSNPATDELFSKTNIALIALLVFNNKDTESRVVIQKAFELLCIQSFDDLRDATSAELSDCFPTFPVEWRLRAVPLMRFKRLIDYLQPDTNLTEDLTPQKIKTALKARETAEAAKTITPEKSSDRKKYEIKLQAWNGEGDTIHPWRDSIEMTLGKIGMADSISDSTFYDRDPESSQQVFYALCEALKDGSAHHYPKDVENSTGRKSAHDLMEKLMSTFNTEESKVHFMVHAMELLFNIVLDHNVTVETFISDWKSIVHRLEKNGSVLADRGLLRVFLLRAIRSSEFDDVIRYINSNPLLPIDDYLKELRAKETNIKMLSGDDPVVKDGDFSAVTRRAQKQTTFAKTSSFKRSDDSFPPWNIPPIPDGINKAMNPKVYGILEAWHKYANKKVVSPNQLNKMFALKVEQLPPKTKRNRRGGTESTTDEDAVAPSSKKPKKEGRARISLAFKARRVGGKMLPKTVTEVDASALE